jgi:hypothetical protein
MDTVQGEMMAFYREIASLEDGGGWRAVGNAIGKSGAYARQLATGKRPVTKKVAAAWASKSGWVCKTVEVPVCPIHGVVHDAGPCTTDKPVVAVVVLGDGERVTRPRSPWQSKAKPEVAAMVAGLQACLERKRHADSVAH